MKCQEQFRRVSPWNPIRALCTASEPYTLMKSSDHIKWGGCSPLLLIVESMFINTLQAVGHISNKDLIRAKM